MMVLILIEEFFFPLPYGRGSDYSSNRAATIRERDSANTMRIKKSTLYDRINIL
ncbi:TPA: hypothetical protein ACLISQ_000851 [Legionella pneumophila]